MHERQKPKDIVHMETDRVEELGHQTQRGVTLMLTHPCDTDPDPSCLETGARGHRASRRVQSRRHDGACSHGWKCSFQRSYRRRTCKSAWRESEAGPNPGFHFICILWRERWGGHHSHTRLEGRRHRSLRGEKRQRHGDKEA